MLCLIQDIQRDILGVDGVIFVMNDGNDEFRFRSPGKGKTATSCPIQNMLTPYLMIDEGDVRSC